MFLILILNYIFHLDGVDNKSGSTCRQHSPCYSAWAEIDLYPIFSKITQLRQKLYPLKKTHIHTKYTYISRTPDISRNHKHVSRLQRGFPNLSLAYSLRVEWSRDHECFCFEKKLLKLSNSIENRT